RYEPGPLLGSLSESPMPIRSGAMQWPSGCRCGNTLRQRYDEVGLPCSSTMGSPSPTSTYAISLPRTRCRCFLYGNEEEIILGSPSFFAVAASLHLNGTPSFEQKVGVGGFSQIPRNGSDSVARAAPRRETMRTRDGLKKKTTRGEERVSEH